MRSGASQPRPSRIDRSSGDVQSEPRTLRQYVDFGYAFEMLADSDLRPA